MKILMATMQMDIGGAETHILELACALSRDGHDVTVISNGGAYVAELHAAGIRHVNAPLHNKRPMNLLKSSRILKKLIAEEHYDIVHSHARIPSFLLAKLEKKMHFPFVTTAHWVFNVKYGLKYLTNWGSKTVAVSEDIREYLMDNYGIASSDIQVTINGIDTEKFSPDTDTSAIREEFHIQPQDRVIVYISRMDESRSLAAKQLISAAPALAQSIPHLRIIIVGGGDDELHVASLSEQANQKIGYSCISLAGARTNINQFAALGELFVGVSRAALEAMAAQRPVIIVGNEGYIGLFDESRLKVGIDTNFCCRGCVMPTSDLIRDEILRYFSMPAAQQKQLGEYGRNLIIHSYSVSRMAEDTMRVYGWALSKQKYILISGYYGYRNSGDDAMLKAIISDLRNEFESPNLVVLSKHPAETQRLYRVRAIGRYHILALHRYCRKAEMLITGGGTLLQDKTSSKSLIYYLSIIRTAQRFGLKTMLYANGIGPLEKKGNIRYAASVINQLSLVTLRDQASFDFLRSIGVTNTHMVVTADPVFSLKLGMQDNGRKLLEEYLPENAQKLMAISVRPWANNTENFEAVISDFCEYASKVYGLTPVIIPMQMDRDLPISLRIAKRSSTAITVLCKRYSVEQLISIMNCMHICVGMRLHSLIFCTVSHVPMIGLSYDPKIDSFLNYVGQTNCLSVSDVTLQELTDHLDQLMMNHEQITEQLQKKCEELCSISKNTAILAKKLYENESNEV